MQREYEYAKDLATHIWGAHYKKDAPDWEPLDDLMGVLTQIDNMVVGLTAHAVDAERCANCGAELRTYCNNCFSSRAKQPHH